LIYNSFNARKKRFYFNGAELSRNLAECRSENIIILLNHQNNYVERSNVKDDAIKSFDILAISLSILRNYFDGSTKLFSHQFLAKFSDTLAKPFFPCVTKNNSARCKLDFKARGSMQVTKVK